MPRVTTSRTGARGGKSAATPKKSAMRKPTRGTTKPAKAAAPKRSTRTPRVAAKPARASVGREQIAGRVDQLERNIATLRTRYSELKRTLAGVVAHIEAQQAAPAKPVRWRGRETEAPTEAASEAPEMPDQE